MKELAVIIPMYNEEDNAEKCVRAVCSVIKDLLPGTRLYVVNDGSRDRTEKFLQTLLNKDLPFTLVSHYPNRGFGGALVAGMKRAYEDGFVFGLFMDSDLTNDPILIPNFAKLLSTGKYDVVKASRYVSGGGMKGVPYYRQLYTIIGNFVASKLFRMGIKDCTNGFHAVRLSLLVDEVFREKGFSFLLEELYILKKKKVRTIEVPYILTSRDQGEGVSKFQYTPTMLWSYLKYALRAALVPR